VIFGTVRAIVAALAASPVSAAVNAVFVERHHGTDRIRQRPANGDDSLGLVFATAISPRQSFP
jgi:hypothetical protein